MTDRLAAALFSLSLLASAAAGQEARSDFSIEDRTLTHRGFQFRMTVPAGWSIEAGQDADSKMPGAQALFARGDGSARGFLEVQWNASIDPAKYLEQVVGTYAGGQTRAGAGKAPSGAARADYRWQTPDGTAARSAYVALGEGPWKYGFGFSAPDSAFADLEREIQAILGSFAPLPKREVPGWTGEVPAGDAGIGIRLPDPSWRTAGSFWEPGDEDEGIALHVVRDPYAAYGFYGSGPSQGKTIDKETERILAHVAGKVGSTRPERTQRVQVVVGGARGVQTRFRNTASFPHQDFWITVVEREGRIGWCALWTLPDNSKALEKEFEVLSSGWTFR